MSNLLTKNNLSSIIETGLITGLCTFILSYTTLLFWSQNGFDLLEISLMTLLAGFYLFVLLIPLNIFLLNKYVRNTLQEGKTPIGKFYQVVLTLIIAFILYLFIDALLFLVDDSVPVAFAEALHKMAESNGEIVPGIEYFASIPFGLQNGILTIIMGFIAALITLPFIKKNGELFANKDYRKLVTAKE